MWKGNTMSRNKVVNKIGYVDNRHLGIGRGRGGHYVYIREYDKATGKCVVNTITSLEDRHGYKPARLKQVKLGNVYSIPKKDINLPLWSRISCNPIRNVDINKIQDLNRVKVKKRHRFFINKFLGRNRYD